MDVSWNGMMWVARDPKLKAKEAVQNWCNIHKLENVEPSWVEQTADMILTTAEMLSVELMAAAESVLRLLNPSDVPTEEPKEWPGQYL